MFGREANKLQQLAEEAPLMERANTSRRCGIIPLYFRMTALTFAAVGSAKVSHLMLIRLFQQGPFAWGREVPRPLSLAGT